MKFFTSALVLCLVSVAVGDEIRIRGASHFQGLGHLPGGTHDSWARDASADGSVVVGWSKNASGYNEAFRWTEEDGMIGLGSLPGGTNGNAYAVSADGSVVVGASAGKAFRWTIQDGMAALSTSPDFPDAHYQAHAVSAYGDFAAGNISPNPGLGTVAAMWSPDFVELSDAPGHKFRSSDARDISADGRTIVGVGWGEDAVEAFKYSDGTVVGLGYLDGGSDNSGATGITPDGATIVGYSRSIYGLEACIWNSGGSPIGLGDLPGGSYYSEATAVSDEGFVVIGNSETNDGEEAFVWTAPDGMLNLEDLLVDSGHDMSGWSNLHAWGISGDGSTIVGIGHNPTGRQAWLARFDYAVVPTPSSITALLGLGAMGLLAFVRHRRR